MPSPSDANPEPLRPVPLGEAFFTWCRVALLSFGGPAGQIAVMHRILVEEKKWINEERFLHALNYCMLLPGPEAQQLATYIGWLLHRTWGGLMAGLLFIFPGFLAILALSIVYASYQETSLVEALFFGLKPAVLAIVLEAVLRIGRRVLRSRVLFLLAGAAFVAIFFFNVPFPAMVVCAALFGLLGYRFAPHWFSATKKAEPVPEASGAAVGWRSHLGRSALVLAVCLTLWFAPLVVIAAVLGTESVFWQEGVFFSRTAVVTFGGAYAVLSYLAQQAVERYGWLEPGEMLDGLGMAETTPGPLIMVVQFVGFLGAYRNPGPFEPLTAGILGSLLTTWVTFVPCFLWVFLGAPYIERLRGNRHLSAALTAITAMVVGVILNLAVWFALHTLFAQVDVISFYGARLQVPEWGTLNFAALGIAAFACLLTFYVKRGMGTTLAVSAALGMAAYAVAEIFS